MGAAKVPTNRRRPDLQFQDLAEHSPVGMAIVQDGRFLYVNPKYCEIFGYGRDELLLRVTPLDLVADADRPRAAESMRTRPRGAPPTVAVEFRGKRKDGSSIDLEFHVADMEIGGRPALIASAMDVTDRKRAAERIHAADRNFLTIFNSVGDAIFVSDATGKFTEVNDAACTMFGYSRVELIGSDIGTLSSGRTPYTQDAALPWLEKARSGLPQLFEWHCRAKDGRLFWAEISLRCLFIKDTHVWLASLRDITERRRFDENQGLGEARFRLLFEEATDAIVVYDLDRDRITEANRKAEQLFECGRDELSRLGLRHFYAPDQPDGQPIEATFFKYGRRAIAGTEAIFERRIRTAKGKNRICEVRLVKLPSSHGNAIRGSFIDVTDRKLAAEKIREDESQFRALAEQGVTGIFVIQNDMSLGYVNPHFTELLGFPHEEVIGRPLLDFVAEADRPGVISAVRKLISGKVASVQLGAALPARTGGNRPVGPRYDGKLSRPACHFRRRHGRHRSQESGGKAAQVAGDYRGHSKHDSCEGILEGQESRLLGL
jgi:PAS domain S-box-containing protein